ncbi:hypothetical protein [Cellvibrio sp. QJXJ]|uniref:hypothetical protein n=1 Tax=Cellvibrio sp. QJXJ TaxID=2964606 RepID=UPI0021C4ADDF|nr:hypothetical protein [Cellvibrio sp. QJXJ]UUA73542.1 hypothetical protein NNX04_03625 [Cellvibrio sp. QJXJ]
MVTTRDLLDLLKEKLGSDYKTAKAFGMTTQRIYKMRHHGGVFTDEQGLKAAEILNFPAEFIILSLAAERSFNSPAYDLLVDITDKFDPRKTAAVAALFIFTGAAFMGEFLPTFQLV